MFFSLLEKALRAFASSSGGAACPGGRGAGVRGQPQGSTPGVRGWFQGDLSEKKILWRTNGLTDELTHGRTDRLDGKNSDLDEKISERHRFEFPAKSIFEKKLNKFRLSSTLYSIFFYSKVKNGPKAWRFYRWGTYSQKRRTMRPQIHTQKNWRTNSLRAGSLLGFISYIHRVL